MASQLAKNLKQPALDFLSFVNASPTCIYDHLSTLPKVYLTISAAFHAVQSAKELLVKAGFQEIKVSEDI